MKYFKQRSTVLFLGSIIAFSLFISGCKLALDEKPLDSVITTQNSDTDTSKPHTFIEVEAELPKGLAPPTTSSNAKVLPSNLTVVAKVFKADTRMQVGSNSPMPWDSSRNTYRNSNIDTGTETGQVYVHVYGVDGTGKIVAQGTSNLIVATTPYVSIAASPSYAIGQMGPGGGYIADYDSVSKRYIEIAPPQWDSVAGDPTYTWSSGTDSISTSASEGDGISNVTEINKVETSGTWNKVNSVSISAAGSLYAVGDVLTLNGGGGVTATISSGGVTTGLYSVALANPGTKWKYDVTDILELTTSTDGGTTGSGGYVDVGTVDGPSGQIITLATPAITATGNNYSKTKTYNTIRISGSGTGIGATITVSAITGGVSSVSLTNTIVKNVSVSTPQYLPSTTYSTSVSPSVGSGATLTTDAGTATYTKAISRFISALTINSVDWTFPTKGDLESIAVSLGSNITQYGFTNGNKYWSSTQVDAANAYALTIGNTTASSNAKSTNTLYLRPVRYFQGN